MTDEQGKATVDALRAVLAVFKNMGCNQGVVWASARGVDDAKSAIGRLAALVGAGEEEVTEKKRPRFTAGPWEK